MVGRIATFGVALSMGLAILLTTAAGAMQYGAGERLAVGRLLVSNKKLGDPNFSESVVLIIQYDADDGTLGLIINRRTKIPLTRLFPNIKGAKGDLVYEGGPVEPTNALALLRLAEKRADAMHVVADVYATGSKGLIENSVAAATPSTKFRVYAGYAGWAPEQLESEIETGAWSVVKAPPTAIFDDDPETLWDRLTREADSQIARNWRRPAPALAAAETIRKRGQLFIH